MIGNISNLEAWAIMQGYEPGADYGAETLPPGYLSPHFTVWEFNCKHCGTLPEEGIDPTLVERLEDARRHFGDKPVTINSGYRCPEHNAAVGGVEESEHTKGTAADFTIADTTPAAVYAYFDPWHEGGLGLYSTFVHIDMRDGRARWTG